MEITSHLHRLPFRAPLAASHIHSAIPFASSKIYNKSNIILPETYLDSNLFVDNSGISQKNTTFEEQNYLDKVYPANSEVSKFVNPIINTNGSSKPSKPSKPYKPYKSSKPFKQTGAKKCNGAKCTYKCDSSYSNAISYLDEELKPIEGFGNIYDNYASLY